MNHDVTKPIPVLAAEDACQIVHSTALAGQPGAPTAEGWYFRLGVGDEPVSRPFGTFHEAAEALSDEHGPPDYTSFEFDPETDTSAFERTLPSDYVHTGSEILIPTILGIDRLEAPRAWLQANGLRYRETPSHYRVTDLFPDDDSDEVQDEPEDRGSSPRP